MKRQNNGIWLPLNGGEPYKAFIPNPLPPDPPITLYPGLQEIMDQALLALGRLDSVTILLPDTSIFLYSYIRKEAVLSAQIEGTQSSLSDLLLFEMEGIPGVPIDDVKEASNYVGAMEHGLKRLREDFPLSLRLIREIHEILLSGGRGATRQPGEFRSSQNWLGGSRPGNAKYVPAPPDRLIECLGDFEKFLNDIPVRMPVLIKAALAHSQFETIHPFLDGNGRLGRLLITLILCNEKVIRQPMLYLSLYFKTHREQYYELLQQTRIDGDFELWIEFFLTAIKETADQAVNTAHKLLLMTDEDRKQVQSLGRAAGSALRVHHALLQRPLLSVSKLQDMTGLQPNTVLSSLQHLIKLGLVREITGRKRDRVFGYSNYIKTLNEGT
ncbi:MAG TPA: Fic family protein [Spirochaetota bacterium]|nr:Fic family protein [Spirochaetota bacterium]HPI89413.1 Fic family protein [Spirochaetota bacterium]HPR49533.1 Fic family protein [Spirochaetota bacterium]